ncbi:MAG: SIMPL domain-containing protein [Anaerolineae bacterium]|nr:SIMPL domain-containing protein [Anaerolineae bacterium]
MKTKVLWVVVSLLVVLSLGACQAASPKTQGRTMNANGTGVVYLTPDLAYITVGVRSEEANVANALNSNTAQSQRIRDALTQLGVEDKDIQTSAFNVYPNTPYSPEGQPLDTTYVVENTVYVTVRDLQSLGQLLDEVVKAGANTIYGISFDVQDKSTAITEARQQAIQNARKNAEEVASAAGVELGDLININVYSSGYASPMEGKVYGSGGDFTNVPVASGQMTITVTADLVYEIK